VQADQPKTETTNLINKACSIDNELNRHTDDNQPCNAEGPTNNHLYKVESSTDNQLFNPIQKILLVTKRFSSNIEVTRILVPWLRLGGMGWLCYVLFSSSSKYFS